MRYLFGFLCVCALGVLPIVGCSDAEGGGGTGGDGGSGGSAGNGGDGTGGTGNMGPTDPCEDIDCNDDNDCTDDVCQPDCTDEDGDGVDDVCDAFCENTNWPKDFPCECVGFICKVCDGSGQCVCDDDEQCEEDCVIGQTCNLATGMCEGGENAPEGTPCSGDGLCDGAGQCVEQGGV